MLTIFEGCDGVGKTTAAKVYAEYTGAVYVHCGIEQSFFKDPVGYYRGKMAQAGKDIVMDRCWLSDQVYGPIVRGGVTLRWPELVELEASTFHMKPIVVLVYATKQTILSNYNSEHEYVKNRRLMSDIWLRYYTKPLESTYKSYAFITCERHDFDFVELFHELVKSRRTSVYG